jgi:hypothetical protein
MIKSSLISIAVFFLTYAVAAPTTAIGQETVQVRGTVTTLYGRSDAVITGAKVIFLSEGKKYEATTDAAGNYVVQVPVGIYQITTASLGFCPYKRSSFQVLPSAPVLMNVILYVCPLANILSLNDKGKYIGEECRYEDPVTNETSLVHYIINENNRPLIRYGKRQDKQDSFEYEGVTINNGEYLGAMVSYDKLTLYADKIRFDKATTILEAQGNVVLEDGKQQSKWSKVIIDFKAKDPISTLTKK